MNNQAEPFFVGDGKRHSEGVHPNAPKEYEPYIASPELIEAVNLSILLGRPLLLEGEAGCGKSRLARAVAYELGVPLFTWHIKSTSSASEGLYRYDALLRLHDIQASSIVKTPGLRDAGDPTNYRTLGPIGNAFLNNGSRSVLLIDEIDKADIDFPNDLLTVLDDPWNFEIPETGENIAASDLNKPIVLITSNKEKGNLPLPFLRRCVYFYLTFPDSEERLREIVEIHFDSKKEEQSIGLNSEDLKAALQAFISLRNNGGLFKKPGTSELLDWLKVLRSKFFEADLEEAIKTKLPFPGTLIKLRADWEKIRITRNDL